MKTISGLGPLRGKRVLVRSDLNVPLADGAITDDGRIRASVPTIEVLSDAGAKVIVLAHLGRPKGEPDVDLTLRPVATRLAELLNRPVAFATDSVGDSAHDAVASLDDGAVVMLENVRFNPNETSGNDAARAEFADRLANLGDAFVSDGFGVVHRKQASVYDVAQRLPSAAGPVVVAEIKILQRLTDDPARPYTVVLGGSKVSDKLGVIDNLLEKADRLVIGGGMVFTFLAAQGYETGTSLLEEDQIDAAREYLRVAKEKGVEINLPTDIVVAPRFASDAPASVVAATKMPPDQMGLDIGPVSAIQFADAIGLSKTVFWNGPMGVFEMDAFAEGTKTVARALAEMAGLSVVGGGDSAAAVRQFGFDSDDFGHISTGGGASLEYLEGKQLPGLEVLDEDS